MVGESPPMFELRESLGFAAKSDTHVLLLGESGTGKELAARALHSLGPAARGKFIARNASTLPSALIDAELFGNARNYPQAGMGERSGLIGEADGGTLFLDEIGELPTELQAHLLRVLDSGGEYQRLGESQVRKSKFRLVAATNRPRDLLKHDFAARFATEVRVPSLADRREDIPLLIRALLLGAAERSPEIATRFIETKPSGARSPRPSRELVQELLVKTYPTNIRELGALLWQAMRESESDELELPSSFAAESRPSRDRREESARGAQAEPTPEEIRAALDANAGNVPAAARALGLSSRYVLNRLLRKHGIR
jgi:DNA-binding NtrC family response regulator